MVHLKSNEEPINGESGNEYGVADEYNKMNGDVLDENDVWEG